MRTACRHPSGLAANSDILREQELSPRQAAWQVDFQGAWPILSGRRMRSEAHIELAAGVKSFATGLLPELISALRRCRSGDLLAVVSSNAGLGADLELWCR